MALQLGASPFTIIIVQVYFDIMHSFFRGAWAACIIFSSGKNLLREKVFNALLHMIISCYVLISLRWEHSGELNLLKSPASTTLIVFVMITLILVLTITDSLKDCQGVVTQWMKRELVSWQSSESSHLPVWPLSLSLMSTLTSQTSNLPSPSLP